MATILHKVLHTWLMVLLFLTFLVLRLDQKVSWNWFIVFIPMWLFDLNMVVYAVFHMIAHCRNRQNPRNELSMVRKVWYLGAGTLKILFQVLLCLRLQGYAELAAYIIVIPLFLLFVIMTGDITKVLFARSKGPNYPMQRARGIRNPPRSNERESF